MRRDLRKHTNRWQVKLNLAHCMQNSRGAIAKRIYIYMSGTKERHRETQIPFGENVRMKQLAAAAYLNQITCVEREFQLVCSCFALINTQDRLSAIRVRLKNQLNID